VRRYLAIATAIVLGSVLALVGFDRTHRSRDEPYAATVHAPASPRPETAGLGTARPMEGDAPWALSALPGCFRQTREIHGPVAYVRAHDADLQRPRWHRVRDARLRTGDCTLWVAEESAHVERGDTHLVIPPDARFYVSGRLIVLDRFDGASESLRSYRLSDGRAPIFTGR
jgi:hypothetical protein